MAKKSAESYVSLKGNDKPISILQNVIKVMEFVVRSEDEDTDTASSEDDYSDADSDFENH